MDFGICVTLWNVVYDIGNNIMVREEMGVGGSGRKGLW